MRELKQREFRDTEQIKRIQEKTGKGMMDVIKGLDTLSILGPIEDEVIIAYLNYNGIKKGIKCDYDYDYKLFVQTLKKYDRLDIAYHFATDTEKALILIIESL